MKIYKYEQVALAKDIPESEITKEAIAEAGGLVTPDEAPTSGKLVGIGTNGSQIDVSIGENLTLVNGILSSTGGGGSESKTLSDVKPDLSTLTEEEKTAEYAKGKLYRDSEDDISFIDRGVSGLNFELQDYELPTGAYGMGECLMGDTLWLFGNHATNLHDKIVKFDVQSKSFETLEETIPESFSYFSALRKDDTHIWVFCGKSATGSNSTLKGYIFDTTDSSFDEILDHTIEGQQNMSASFNSLSCYEYEEKMFIQCIGKLFEFNKETYALTDLGFISNQTLLAQYSTGMTGYTLGSKIYFFGGYLNGKELNIYDIGKETMIHSGSVLPIGSSLSSNNDWASIFYRGYLYLSQRNSLNMLKIRIIDNEIQCETIQMDSATPQYQNDIIEINDEYYMFGGQSGNSYTTSVYKVSLDKNDYFYSDLNNNPTMIEKGAGKVSLVDSKTGETKLPITSWDAVEGKPTVPTNVSQLQNDAGYVPGTQIDNLSIVRLTQAEYEALTSKDPDTLYIITEE